LHIAGLFYASALAASVTMPLALVAARPSDTSDQFLLRDNSSNAQRAKNSGSSGVRVQDCTLPCRATLPIALRAVMYELLNHWCVILVGDRG
jgi:hypothetical protein